MPQSFATPALGSEARSVFSLAHEIYHNEFQTLPGGIVTAEQWGYNEAVASLAAFRTVERIAAPQFAAPLPLSDTRLEALSRSFGKDELQDVRPMIRALR